jgi:hypothetical protein
MSIVLVAAGFASHLRHNLQESPDLELFPEGTKPYPELAEPAKSKAKGRDGNLGQVSYRGKTTNGRSTGGVPGLPSFHS